MKPYLVAFAFLLSGLALLPPARGQQAPPVGEERHKLLESILKDYPDLPAELANALADQRNHFTRELPRSVYDWFAKAPAGVSEDTASRAASYANVCVLPHNDLTPESAAAKLGDKPFAVEAANGAFTIIGRADNMIYACCAPQLELMQIGGSDLWARRLRMKDLDRAFTSVLVIDPQNTTNRVDYDQRFVWRGPNAPAAHREIPFEALKGRIEDRVIDSDALGEKRKVGVYLPPGWTKEKTWPVVFVGDTGHAAFYPTVEAMVEDGQIAPMIIIGVGSGWEAKVDGDLAEQNSHARLRNSEYMPGFAQGDLFDRHLKYMAEEVTAWAAREYNASTRREERVIAGFSGGGTMALFTGLRRPDVFGYSIPMSPSWTAPTSADLAPGQRAIFHMSGGVYEPDFHINAKRFEKLMREADFDIVVEYPVSGHFPDHWRHVFANAMLRFFPKQS